MSDTITLDIGGRLYKTTIATLKNSGSAYFQSLLARWMPSSNSDGDDNTLTTRTSRGQRKKKKRSRDDDEDDIDVDKNEGDIRAVGAGDRGSKTIFVDGDPDVFEEILYFMRRSCIKPATNFNPFLLRMLLKEAQFFAYDALVDVCETKLKNLETDVQKESDACKVTAHSHSYFVSKGGQPVKIHLKTNEVLYIASAVLLGRCHIQRYLTGEEDEEDEEKEEKTTHCYLNTCEKHDTGDFQLHYQRTNIMNQGVDGYDMRVHCISHVGLDQIHCGDVPMNIDFRQTIDLCITSLPAAGYDYVRLSASGSGLWHVHCWVGLPENIPMVGRGGAQNNYEETKKRRYIQSMSACINSKKKTDDEKLALMVSTSTTVMTAAMLAML